MKIALLQCKASATAELNLDKTLDAARRAALQGAKIICTQELFLSPYFCIVQDSKNFNLAEKIPGKTTEAFAALCKELKVVMVISLFEDRDGMGRVCHNTSVVINADGEILGQYRKMHIPQDPYFEEKFYFTPGDLGYRVFDTAYGKIGVLICWDQWYPEAARLTALKGADIIFYPTAIGTLPEESPQDLKNFKTAWQTVQRGHAVANGVYVAAVNRTGKETALDSDAMERTLKFWGGSFVADPYGAVVAEATENDEGILFADVDFEKAKQVRRTWPFFRDRRIDSYEGITKRYLGD